MDPTSKRSLANLTKRTVDQLARLIKVELTAGFTTQDRTWLRASTNFAFQSL